MTADDPHFAIPLPPKKEPVYRDGMHVSVELVDGEVMRWANLMPLAIDKFYEALKANLDKPWSTMTITIQRVNLNE